MIRNFNYGLVYYDSKIKEAIEVQERVAFNRTIYNQLERSS